MDQQVEWDEYGRMRWGCAACGIKDGWYLEKYADEHYELYHQGARPARGQGIGGAGQGQGGGANGGGRNRGANGQPEPGARGGRGGRNRGNVRGGQRRRHGRRGG